MRGSPRALRNSRAVREGCLLLGRCPAQARVSPPNQPAAAAEGWLGVHTCPHRVQPALTAREHGVHVAAG